MNKLILAGLLGLSLVGSVAARERGGPSVTSLKETQYETT